MNLSVRAKQRNDRSDDVKNFEKFKIGIHSLRAHKRKNKHWVSECYILQMANAIIDCLPTDLAMIA